MYDGSRGALLRRVDELWLESHHILSAVETRHRRLSTLKAAAHELDEKEDEETLKSLIAIIEKTLAALPKITLPYPVKHPGDP